ncbi:MAG: PKD domain-containing protein, partial [Thermoplasmata archaeon]|nr:PKD domain-containing protein [Thermoplasmata archaeon]
TYTIAFRITDDDGSQDMVFRTIVVTDLGPNAVISINVLSHSEGTLVVFNAGPSTSSPDELVYYYWDWEGDGEVDETTMEVNGRHTFTTPGRYEVTLTVEDDDGSTDTDSVYVTITDIGPTVKLDADPTPEGEVALLDASGTEEPGDDFLAFRWDLDDDGVWDREETCSSLEVVWDAPGMYRITVQVEDEDGSMASKSMTLLISDVAPQVDVGGPYTVDEGTPLEISGAATYEAGDDFTVFRWDVDNNGKWDIEGLEDKITWTYDVAGVYTIRLYVEDEDGSSGVGTVEVEVIDLDPVFTIVLPTNVMENVAVNFTLDGLSDPGTVDFIVTWYFGDGKSASGVTVEHAFPEQGAWSGRVTVEDNEGTVINALWPTKLQVANNAPVVELSETVLNAVEDSQFTVSVFGHDTTNDTITYSFNGAGGKIDPKTGVFNWTPLDEHVDKQKFTFIATDEDGGEGTLEVVIHIEDVDNDFLGMSTATGLALLVVMVLVLLVVIIIVARQRGLIGGKDDKEDVI